jgi:predicted Rossmann fold flavoprotein
MIVVVGGGAAGFFAAINAKEKNPTRKVIILEKTASLLTKVKISGGGRCNVTHGCFDPKHLITHYPRGNKELLSPFYQFQPQDIIKWLEDRHVVVKEESDGRIFPKTDSSQEIINCFLQEANKLGIDIRTCQKIEKITQTKNFTIQLEKECLSAEKLILATGSSKDGFSLAASLGGHTIIPPIPSIFTFNAPESPLKPLSGIDIIAKVSIAETPFVQTAPLLLTHFGFSGPAILRLSSWAARVLYEKQYQFTIVIDWLPNLPINLVDYFIDIKKKLPQKTLQQLNIGKLPKNLWKHLTKNFKEPLLHLSKDRLKIFERQLRCDCYAINGKTPHKEEFVTCGGVALKEVCFATMESKLCKNLYFAGEILDIDGITGGFNFQNAWTTGFIAGCCAAR